MLYAAEGRKKKLICNDPDLKFLRVRRAEIKASRTDFLSGISVFHLILCPEIGSSLSALNEYDIIKFVKLWEGGEEIWELGNPLSFINCVKFRIGEKDTVSIEGIAELVFGKFDFFSKRVRAGTIELILEEKKGNHMIKWDLLWKSLLSIKEGFYFNMDPFEYEFKENLTKAILGVAGIFQGLLDFDFIDMSELRDVFKHTNLDEWSLIGIHKGTLLYITTLDRAYEVTSPTIGISPYLIIPHSILLHNEELLIKASETAEKANSKKLKILEEARREMQKLLNRDYLPNLFHYQTEKMLYEIGENSRGLANFREVLYSKLSEISAEWEAKIEKRRKRAEDIIAGLLLIISGLQIKDIISPFIIVPILSIIAIIYIILRNWK